MRETRPRAVIAAMAMAAMPLAAQDGPGEDAKAYPAGFSDRTENGAEADNLPHAAPTRVISLDDLNRIAAPKGITLQWIDWDTRGEVRVLVDGDGVWQMFGSQSGPDGAYVEVDGVITEVGRNYFTFTGKITIENTPDAGRKCEATDNWRFEITQNRKYYRLRQFEWCDNLTDYIDIYF